jgi:hypothetical protein
MDLSRTDDKRGIGAVGAVLIGVLALLATAAPAGAAEDAPLVPPGNSAVNQYTEAFPTAGGERDANNRKGKRPSSEKVIGERNTAKLRKQGPEGEAVADLTAETAPAPPADEDVVVEEGAAAPPGSAGGGSGNGSGESQAGSGASDGGGSGGTASVVVAEPEGSSGLGEVIARATGSSSGDGMGLFLPLLILATILWAFAYLARQKRPAS